MKRLFSFILITTMLLSSMVVFAQEMPTTKDYEVMEKVIPKEGGQIGVSENKPGENAIVPFDVTVPTSIWDVVQKGQYNIGGSADIVPLYTNYKFTGKTQYSAVITNYHSSTLKIKLSGGTGTNSWTVSPGGTLYFFPNASSTSNPIYLTFEKPSNFSGYIK